MRLPTGQSHHQGDDHFGSPSVDLRSMSWQFDVLPYPPMQMTSQRVRDRLSATDIALNNKFARNYSAVKKS
jgi:hypothetical protein